MEFEKLGAFYLGKEYDVAEGRVLDRLVMYDARDLTTHGVCVGMTGSGKTGLCISLLEEAALDGVPALIIDPKGDMTNLLLSFPELAAQDFRPWINPDDARRKGLDEDAYAAQQAEQWRRGLAEWGQDGGRIRMLREAADMVIYTPGSDAGVSVSMLQSFAAPRLIWQDHAELIRERVSGTVSALLGLIGVEADPVRSREHILLANIVEHFWRQGQDLDLARLILAVQDPPVRQLGVFDVDTFYPAKDRFALAVSLNSLVAAPSFRSWLQGQPLDISGFLSTPEGRPRHSIFYLAHLSDPERMFFVTMLLNQVTTWMRTLSGTTSLRALLYMDEIAGFFPPVANPPSKAPMLTLLKQARAFGLGVLLTTQNPVDLDYKGLTNTGTWFIGRLQAERDKLRLLDGLQSVTPGAGLDRASLDRLISGLDKRVFLLHNVHAGGPLTFYTRWAMSYLRGPLTRPQVRTLMVDRRPEEAPVSPTVAREPVEVVSPSVGGARREATVDRVAVSTAPQRPSTPPPLPRGQRPVFLPVRRGATAARLDLETTLRRPVEIVGEQLVYEPAVVATASVRFVDQRRGVDVSESYCFVGPPPDRPGKLDWGGLPEAPVSPDELGHEPEVGAVFAPLPETLNESPEFTALRRDLAEYLYRSKSLRLLYHRELDFYSRPGESEREFHMRLQQEARERRDQEVDALAARYAKRLDAVERRLRRAEDRLTQKRALAEAHSRETIVSVGESILGMFLGRRSARVATTALSKHRQSTSARLAAEQSEEEVKRLREEIEGLQKELAAETQAVRERWEAALSSLEEYRVTPRRIDVVVDVVTLGWAPHWEITYRDGNATRAECLIAY